MKILKNILQAPGSGPDEVPAGGAAVPLTDSAQPAADKKSTAPKPEPSSQDSKAAEAIEKLREDNAAKDAQNEKNRRYDPGQPDPNNPWVDVFKGMRTVGNLAGDTVNEIVNKITGGPPASTLFHKIKAKSDKSEKKDAVDVGAHAGAEGEGEEMEPVAGGTPDGTPPAGGSAGGRPGV